MRCARLHLFAERVERERLGLTELEAGSRECAWRKPERGQGHGSARSREHGTTVDHVVGSKKRLVY